MLQNKKNVPKKKIDKKNNPVQNNKTDIFFKKY